MTDLPWSAADGAASDATDARPVRRVICLCAAWCVVCTQYQPQFEALAAQHPDVEFRWVDVEDEEEAMGDYDVETFPSLLISEGDEVRFLGPVLPQIGLINTLLKRLMQEKAQSPDVHAVPLLQRLASTGA